MKNTGIYTVIRLGGSKVVTIPARCAEELGIEAGDLLNVTWDNERMTVEKYREDGDKAEGRGDE